MTTPLIYLSARLQKTYNNDTLSNFIYYVEENILIEFMQNREDLTHKEMKYMYLDYFVQWNSFHDLCNDIFMRREISIEGKRQKINEIEPIFQEVFPLDKNKLLKIWNLKPKSEIFHKERTNCRIELSSPKRGMLIFAKTWESLDFFGRR